MVVFCVRVFFYHGTSSRIVIKHYETSDNNFNLKNRRIFFMCFMSNGFQTVYDFCKELHLDLTGLHALVLVVSASTY